MNREIELGGIIDKRIQPGLHLLALPARDRLFIDGFRFVRHYEVFVDAGDDSHTLALGAGSYRVVEIKEVFAGFDELDTIRLKPLGEHLCPWTFVTLYTNLAFALSFKESGLHAVGEAVAGRLLMIDDNTIDEQIGLVSLCCLPGSVVQTHCVAVYEQTAESLALPECQLLLQGTALRQHNRTKQVETCALRLLLHVGDDVTDGVLFHFLPAHGRVRPAYARVQ